MDQNGRLKTYIEGFDGTLEGGIPRGHIVLVAGTPGTMKSSLAYYILYNQAKEGQTCVYVTLEQSRASLLRQMENLGLRTEEVKQNLNVLDLGLIRKSLDNANGGEVWLRVFKTFLASLKNELHYSVIVIDSLGALEALADMSNRRADLFHLFEWLRDLDSTVLLISEASPDRLFDGTCGEGHLADGIMTLRMQPGRQAGAQRTICCVKMRETNQDPSPFTLLYRDGHFQATKAAGE